MLAGYLVCSVRRRGAMCWDQMLPDLRTQCEPAGPPWANGIDRQACFLGGIGDMGRSSFGYLKQHPLNVVTNGCNASAFITSPWTWGTLFFPLLAFAACFAMSSELERVRTEVNPLVWVSSGVAMPMCLAFHFSWQSWPFFHIKVLKWKSINRFCITL